MGLDIYVMPLSRFWSGCWESVQAQFGRKLGLPGWTIRPFSEPERHPDEAPVFPTSYSDWVRSQAEILAHHRREGGLGPEGLPPAEDAFPPLRGLLRELDLAGVPWSEEDWTRCAQVQLGWDCLTALTDYSQAEGAGGGTPVPPQAIRSWACPPLREGGMKGIRFPHLAIVSAHLGQWLPSRIQDLVCVQMANSTTGEDEMVVFGSLLRLLAELDDLNRDWRITRDWGELGKGEAIAAEDDPHAQAKTGWAIVRSMCRRAVELDLPLILSG